MIITDHLSVPLLIVPDPYRTVSLIVGLDGKPLRRERPLGEVYLEELRKQDDETLLRWKREYLCDDFPPDPSR